MLFFFCHYYFLIDLQWLVDVFFKYLDEWEQEVVSIPGIEKKDQRRMCLSLETLEGMKISGLGTCIVYVNKCFLHSTPTVNSFTELAPKLLALPGVHGVPTK